MEDLAPVMDWDNFNELIQWRQDQHLAAIGPTGQGKTTVIHGLIDNHRKYVVYFATKPRDKTLEKYIDSGVYTRITDWPMTRGRVRKRLVTPDETPKRLLWPNANVIDADIEQRRVFQNALDDIYTQGGWCTVLDDYWYMTHILGFEKHAKKFLMNARSNDIPLVVAAQRPAGNKLVEIFDQADHLLFFRDNDETNLKRISGVGWLDSQYIRDTTANLDRYQFLYVNTRTGQMARSTAPEL